MIRYLHVYAAVLCFALSFISPASAQTTASAPPHVKMAFINTRQFEDSVRGIRKIVAAMQKLEAEFKPKQTEVLSLNNRLEVLAKELKSLSGQTASAKYEEAQKLERDIKYKQELYQQQFERRRQQLLQPVYTSLGNALAQWGKANGYTLVVDVSKDDKGLFLWMQEGAVEATTTTFVQYYNALPSP